MDYGLFSAPAEILYYFYNVLRNVFLQGTFPKSLEVSEKSLWSK
jgi:hypothetical protein